MDPMPIALGFAIGVGLFAAWVAFLVRGQAKADVADQHHAHVVTLERRHAARAASAPAPVARPIDTARVVRAGSFCRVPGSLARSGRGETMVCSPSANGRPRWRRADRLKQTA
jgi:hypothetical protein